MISFVFIKKIGESELELNVWKHSKKLCEPLWRINSRNTLKLC